LGRPIIYTQYVKDGFLTLRFWIEVQGKGNDPVFKGIFYIK